jgi:hypothetical protein
MRSERASLAVLVGMAILAMTSAARAQFEVPLNSLEYNDDTGQLEGVQGDIIKIRDSKNDAWLITTIAATKVSVTGEAEPECLRPGLFVQFKGEIDKKGTLQSPIEEIEIISVESKSSLGLFAPGEGDAPARPVRTATAGEFLIKGKLLSSKDGQLMVLAGSRKINGATGDKLAVKLNVDDPSLAQAGDTVKVKAWYYDKGRPVAAINRPGQALAEEITITLSKPLAYSGKKARPSEKSAKPAAKSGRVSK